jgi:Cu(I)/Ag(I) efflux system membrane fusion protein
MRLGETRSLGLGMCIGMVVASVAFVLWMRSRGVEPEQQTPAAREMPAQSDQAATDTANAAMAVQLTDDEQRQIGIQTTEAIRQAVTEEIVATGRVEEAETTIRTISARVGGRIDRLFLTYTGQPVRVGQPVAEIYSPEVFTAAEEYKLALENRRHLAASQQPDAIAQADGLVQASQRRLALWGLSPKQIEELVTTPDTPVRITINAGYAGVIRTRNVTEGQYVNAGDALFDVVDLNSVWVKADVFQSDIGRIRPGLKTQITSEALPGITLSGEVNFIELQSNMETRTTPVRIQVANPGTRLRPGMFVRATFQIPLGANVLTVPRSAVIDTGMEKMVYLALPGGVFERRMVETGPATNDNYTVLKGLSEGDRVVTKGAFLIDSQTRLTGGMTGLFGGSRSFSEPTAPGTAGGYRMTLRMEPDPPAGAQENTVHVSIVDPSNMPVTDAQVRMTIVMPAMPSMGMPEMRSGAELRWNGSEYVGPIGVSMAGPWNVVIEARRGNEVLATYRSRFDAR